VLGARSFGALGVKNEGRCRLVKNYFYLRRTTLEVVKLKALGVSYFKTVLTSDEIAEIESYVDSVYP
jgi:hypothetical protein